MSTLDSFHVIYLTGAPGTGKTTLGEYLEQSINPLRLFRYSQRLNEYLNQKHETSLGIADLRQQSAQLATPDDIIAVDKLLIEAVTSRRSESHIIVDSHAVTKESYGYRVTPFSLPVLGQLAPTMICVLYADPATVVDRISANQQGRPTVSLFEAAFHGELQATVALTYAIDLHIPIYFLDSTQPVQTLAGQIVKRLQTRNASTQYTPI